jgi:hypothetical protein
MKKIKRRYGHSGRHQRQRFVLPVWVEQSKDACLRSIAEEVYTAKGLADGLNADSIPSCESSYRAGLKALKSLENEKLKSGDRCEAGERAMRKFWEAKVAARQARAS